MSQLYLVATPIGNLGDLSPRGIETLQSVDFIVAEDTRITQKLLNHFHIKKPLYSYHQHNQKQRGVLILDKLLAGQSCGVVSDAGMPCISDPGEQLVSACADAGIPVRIIPGANAAVSALAISGLPCTRFSFEGFLSTNRKNRISHLNALVDESRTMIFYEAPHKLCATLADFQAAFGAQRRIALVREMTKIYEEVIRTTIGEAMTTFAANKPKGEFVIVVAGKPDQPAATVSMEEAVAAVKALMEQGHPLTQAARQVAKQTPFSKSTLYRALTHSEPPISS